MAAAFIRANCLESGNEKISSGENDSYGLRNQYFGIMCSYSTCDL